MAWYGQLNTRIASAAKDTLRHSRAGGVRFVHDFYLRIGKETVGGFVEEHQAYVNGLSELRRTSDKTHIRRNIGGRARQ